MKTVLYILSLFICTTAFSQDTLKYKVVKDGKSWSAMVKDKSGWREIHPDTINRLPSKHEKHRFKSKEQADSVCMKHKKASEIALIQQEMYQRAMRNRRN